MTTQEAAEVAKDIARKLSSYPMLITILLLVAAIVAIHYFDTGVMKGTIQKLVFEQLDFDRELIRECLDEFKTKGERP